MRRRRCYAPRLGRQRFLYLFSTIGFVTVVYSLLQCAMLWYASVEEKASQTPISEVSRTTHYSRSTQPLPNTTKTIKKQSTQDQTEDIEDDYPLVPIYLAENPKYKPSNTSKHKHFLSIRHQGGLGNQMFAYASLWGISHKSYMQPLWPAFQILRNYFHLGETMMTEATEDKSWSLYLEEGANLYDDRTAKLNYDIDIVLLGFYQSWKYFQQQKNVIHRHFQFRDEILGLSQGYLMQAYEESYGLWNISRSTVTYIGVHIRRGDMLHEHNVKKGYTVASRAYLETAMIFFSSRYDNALFIVCSDDMPWSIRNVPKNIAPIAFSTGHYDIEDLAILSSCNHTIMTVGTFGWWAAWLAGGTVMYYADFPARHSELEMEFDPKDVYPSDWRGISYRIKKHS